MPQDSTAAFAAGQGVPKGGLQVDMGQASGRVLEELLLRQANAAPLTKLATAFPAQAPDQPLLVYSGHFRPANGLSVMPAVITNANKSDTVANGGGRLSPPGPTTPTALQQLSPLSRRSPTQPQSIPVPGSRRSSPQSMSQSQGHMGALNRQLAGLSMAGQTEFPMVPPEQDLVKLQIVWRHAGEKVEIEGSYDNWHRRQPLRLQPNGTFSIDAYLPPGVFQFKFIVDGDWRYDPWLPVARDEDGNLNNVIEVNDLNTSYELPNDFQAPDSPQSLYLQAYPCSAEMINEPLVLPPQFNVTPLDLPEDLTDDLMHSGASRPLVPAQHAVTNHLYIDTQAELSLVMGCTIRWRSKCIHTVLYKPKPIAMQ